MRVFVWVVALFLFAACGADAEPPVRCELCGMRVEPGSGWRAGGSSASGATLAFDTPKCLFRYRHTRGAITEPWVIEYYTQARRPAAELFYVIGTDLEGPMGRDLVPVAERDAADQLLADHHGERVLAFDEVDAATVETLFAPRP